MITITMENTELSPFHFLALPPELRNYIYADVFTVNTTYAVKLPQPWVYLHARRRGESPPRQHPSSRLAILQVSKLVCQEAKEIFYKDSIFLFKVPAESLP